MSIDALSFRQYPGADASVASVALPPSSIVPDAIQQALPTKFLKSVIKPLGSNTVQSGQPLEFNLPFSNGQFLKAGSMYITCNLKLSTNNTATVFGFKGAQGSANRLFNRLTLTYGSQVIEDLNFYGKMCSDVINPWLYSSQNENVQSAIFGGCAGAPNHLPFSQATGALSNQLAVHPNTNYSATGAGTQGAIEHRLVIPIMSSFLQGGVSGEDIPLFAMSAPMSLRFLVDATTNVFQVPAGAINTWELNDISLVYTSIQPDASYVATLVQAMNSQGKMFPISINTVNSFQPALSNSTSVLQTINARSINAVAVAFNNASENNGILGSGFCKAYTGATASDVGTLRLYLDNELINMYPDGLQKASDRLAESLTAIYGNLTDMDISLPFSLVPSQNTYGSYMGQYFVNWINTQCYRDADCVKRGIPASQLRLDITASNTQSGDVVVVYTFYEKIIFFGALGSMQVVQ